MHVALRPAEAFRNANAARIEEFTDAHEGPLARTPRSLLVVGVSQTDARDHGRARDSRGSPEANYAFRRQQLVMGRREWNFCSSSLLAETGVSHAPQVKPGQLKMSQCWDDGSGTSAASAFWRRLGTKQKLMRLTFATRPAGRNRNRKPRTSH